MESQSRIDFLVKSLNLLPHPEGGFYKETFRSVESIETVQGERNLFTSILFLLTSENVSRFHRIKSDELWFFHEGSPLTVHTLGETGYGSLSLGLSSSGSGCLPQQLVKANTIFGSTVDQPESYSLVSCVVAPGFDFRDFELFETKDLLPLFPKAEAIIRRLT
ncbi:MAG: cupin domain-containing protein [Algoriphagus sp.]|nr:cupin domain-containing protein [Algoriphagus sp.]